MKTRLTLMVAAVLLALVGTSAVFAYVRHADTRAVAAVQPTGAYVAQHTVYAGTSLQDALDGHEVVRESFPRKSVPADAITQLNDQIGALVATSDIAAGSVLLNSAFDKQHVVTAGLPIPDGDLALSVALEDPQRVGGFVKAGSDIAVFDTYNTVVGLTPQGALQPGNERSVAGDGLADGHTTNRVTRLLLPRVHVIAVGSAVADPQGIHQSAQADSGQRTSTSQVVIVTLAVTQDQAERLIQATQTGHLYLALLTQDSNVAPGPGVDSTNLFH